MSRNLRTVSIVVPVYQGEATLTPLLEEIVPWTEASSTPKGRPFQVCEVLLVHDGARDGSASVIEQLAERFPFVKPIWLSRNFGQHPATLAGMANSTGSVIVTLDEDGQHAPDQIGALLDHALDHGSQLVYAAPTNPPPHGFLRNLASGIAKWIFTRCLGPKEIGKFNSFRLVDGEIGRSLAAYCGPGIYLDVALGWVVSRTSHCPIALRTGVERPSGYSFSKLMAHFIRLVLTSGTRPLRLVFMMGVFSLLVGIGLTIYALLSKVTNAEMIPGWTSMMIVVCFFSGCILISLGIIAEYLGAVVGMSMGRPLYLIVSRPPSLRERSS
jgi:undecaprenyl-phosphate 4-deoxy-4-formamido-L-arabinose transferase